MDIVGAHVELVMRSGREDDARAFYDKILGIPEVTNPPLAAETADLGPEARRPIWELMRNSP
jgi:catechol 2,3-dioxygenase-like lactoylglutathione lyase family enzyme